MADIATPVLIVGGGPVGLAASICLSRFGVRSLLVGPLEPTR
jgi:2-polyprenyl-6-methoxyphenol hydroxylase-like FAD-dependent oxidoreductase